MAEHKTLRELYMEQGDKPLKPAPPTPKQEFVNMLAELTASSPSTVTQWVLGNRRPDRIKQIIIAKHFGSTPEELFRDYDSD